MAKEKITKLLNKDLDELNIFTYKDVDSTNNVARELIISGIKTGLVVADRQTAGRGRTGHSFFSPENSGVYMSYFAPFDTDPSTPETITARAAVACALALESLCGTRFGIKWVNDIYYGPRKIAGILTEGIFSGDGSGYYVLGIGINVSTEGFPEDIKDSAGALSLTGIIPSHEEIIAGIINEFTRLNTVPWLEEYKSRLMYVGEAVSFAENGNTVFATMLGVNDECALLARLDDGTVREIKNGEVSLLRPHR